MKKTNILQTVKLIVLGLVLSVGTGYLFADYTAPNFAPPTCPTATPGCNVPLNIGAAGQAKEGELTLGSLTPSVGVDLRVIGTSIIDALTTQTLTNNNLAGTALLTTDKLKVVSGRGDGKVLTSDADGNATWEDVGGFSFSSSFAFKRSATTVWDSVSYCPSSHPYVISCNTVDDEAPAVSNINTMTTPCTEGSEGGCNTAPNSTSAPQTRGGLGGDYQYKELVRSSSTNSWGCLVYDSLHQHSAYKIDLLCSK